MGARAFLEARFASFVCHNLDHVEEVDELAQRSLDSADIPLSGVLFEGGTDLADLCQPVAPSITFHAMTDESDCLEITPLECLTYCQHVPSSVAEKLRDQCIHCRLDEDPDRSRVGMVSVVTHERRKGSVERRICLGQVIGSDLITRFRPFCLAW